MECLKTPTKAVSMEGFSYNFQDVELNMKRVSLGP